jgi:hypothetical protein
MTTPAQDRESALDAIEAAIARSRRLRLVVSDYVMQAENALTAIRSEVEGKTVMDVPGPGVPIDPYVTPLSDADRAVRDSELAAAASTLTAEVAALNVSVHELQQAQAVTPTQEDLQKRDLGIKLIAAFSVVIALVAAGLVFFIVQLRTSVHEQCYVDSLFLDFYSAKSRAAAPMGTVAYDQGFIRLQGSADRLGCGLKHVVPGT